MDKKYKLTNETIVVNGKTLYRIEALKNFGYVKRGDKGGFVESEKNLSHEGNAWVFDNAKVYDNARVYGHAILRDNAQVYGNAKVCDITVICGNKMVCHNTKKKTSTSLLWLGDGVNSPLRCVRVKISEYLG